jgi:SAM-dependent methyltransferase
MTDRKTTPFDYDADTKHFYSDEVAGDYHHALTEAGGLRGFRVRLVANRERALVRRFLYQVPHKTVLDIPAGTGKLAPLLKEAGSSVMACDISASMLSIGKSVYAGIGHDAVEFRLCDAEQITATLQKRFDLAVCLRLLHRVPRHVKERVLSELSQAADHVIVSAGVDSFYHRARRTARGALLGGDPRALGAEPLADLHAVIGKYFRILGSAQVLPVLSQEVVFLLRPLSREP